MQPSRVNVQEQEQPSFAQVRPNTHRGFLAAKRGLDLLVSGIGLLVCLLLLPFAAAAIKIEDPKGKVFYSQLRTGKDGVPFRMYKLRSMYSNADETKAALMAQNEMDGPVFKIKNDPRVTKFGRFIRKTSIDELPQLWNVIKGDLSIVGPRPLPVEEASGCNAFQRQRELVRPGLTCTWQVSGRNNITFERWMEMDVEYVANQNLRTDILVFLKTIPAVLLSKGAS